MNLRFLYWLFVFLALNCCLELSAEECLSENSNLYYVGKDTSINQALFDTRGNVISVHYKNIFSATGIKSIAYEADHKEMLFVSTDSPNYIQGISETIDVHTVVHQSNTIFDSIVVDPSTGNIYYTENGRGIGVCSGHGLNIGICTLLIEEAGAVYDDLILYPKMGTMVWIQGNSSLGGPVKMASMNGEHVREIKTFLRVVYGLSLDFETGNLYMADSVSVETFNLNTRSKNDFSAYKLKKILYLNCRLYSIDRLSENAEPSFSQSPYNSVISFYFLRPSRATKFISSLVWNNDQSRAESPCKQVKCKGFCVIGEGFPGPQPKCVCENCVRSEDKKEVAQIEDNSTNGFLIALTILLSISTLILGTALVIIHFGLWTSISARFARISGKETPTSTTNGSILKLANTSDDL